LFSTLSYATSITSTNKSEVVNALSDKTVTTISAATLNGKVLPNSFTGYFSKDGKMNGGFSNATQDAPQSDKETWQVKNNGSLCMTWEHWFGVNEECVNIYQLKNGLLIIGSDRTFESVILSSDIKAGNQL